MNQEVRISICVPARNRPEGLEHLMKSVLMQTYKHYEVIIQDNSDGNELEEWYRLNYSYYPNIHYFRNAVVLNMGANWNACVANAGFEWIKMMHDDDWFVDEHSLEIIANGLRGTSTLAHTFAYYNITESGMSTLVKENKLLFRIFQRFPYYVYKRNYIGNPCCTVVHRTCQPTYHDQLKWLVDVHYYLRLMLSGYHFEYHKTPVVNIGISDQQATFQYKHNVDVELHEHDLMAMEFESRGYFKSYFVFDTLWRLVRNVGVGERDCYSIKNINTQWLLKYCIRFQKSVPNNLLRIRFISGITKPIAYFFSIWVC